MSKDIAIRTNEPITFDVIEKMGAAIAKSGLFGVTRPEQAIALMLVAQAEGVHPATVARDYDIIKGRPSKKAEAMQRDFLSNGGKIEWIELSDKMAKAKFSHHLGGEITIDWTMERAAKAGLVSAGGMYQKYPRNMLRARCLSEGVRTIFPIATSGFYTPEEVTEIEHEEITDSPKKIEVEKGKPSNLKAMISKKTETETIEAEVVEGKKESPILSTEQGKIKDLKVKPKKVGNGNNFQVLIGDHWHNCIDENNEAMGKKIQDLCDSGCEVLIKYVNQSKAGKIYRVLEDIEAVPGSSDSNTDDPDEWEDELVETEETPI